MAAVTATPAKGSPRRTFGKYVQPAAFLIVGLLVPTIVTSVPAFEDRWLPLTTMVLCAIYVLFTLGWTTLVAADYSQIELRILAHVSGDEHLRDAFAREADIHRETAARVLRKAPEDVTSDERSMAKMVNFGLAYGMSDFGLASRAGISRQDAGEFVNSYFAAYGGISRYMLHIRETAAEQGYVATLLGRRRQIPELQSANRALKAAGERMAINMPIQGTAADIMKIAMIRTDRALRDGGFQARVVLSVHDELLIEAPRDEVDRLIPVLREAMEGALPLSVPLTVEVKVGDSWEGMAPGSRRDAVLAEADEAPAALEVQAGT